MRSFIPIRKRHCPQLSIVPHDLKSYYGSGKCACSFPVLSTAPPENRHLNMALSVREIPGADAQPPKWIYRPALDLIVGCGAWSLPLLAAAFPLSSEGGLQMSLAFYSLTIFFNNPHYFATIYR